MADISFQMPMDQPLGRLRLLDCLKEGMQNADFSCFNFIVAFAKAGPLIRLLPEIKSWTASGKKISAVFGVDAQGTSIEALEFAQEFFSEVYIVHNRGIFSPTFHPKFYVFHGDSAATAYVGSNNLTVGGTETNFEMFTKIGMSLPEDQNILADINALWDETLTISRALDPQLLELLIQANIVCSERQMRQSEARSSISKSSSKTKFPDFPRVDLKPPSSIPRPPKKSQRKPAGKQPKKTVSSSIGAMTLIMQITPHHNGEVFLSKTAVDQSPDFFGWPFTGMTSPKKKSNKPYPQRDPDPVISLSVFDESGKLKIQHDPFNLNTVYYSPKSEIRVTVPPDVVRATPESSLLVMRLTDRPGYDYVLDIYVPGSAEYDKYLNSCNQVMPSGGKSNPRRFGWL